MSRIVPGGTLESRTGSELAPSDRLKDFCRLAGAEGAFQRRRLPPDSK